MLEAFYAPGYYSHVGRRRSALKQKVWDALRDATATHPRGLARVGTPILRALARHQFDVLVPGGPFTRAVDFGCGHGDLLMYLKSRGSEVLGIERDEQAIAVARAHGLDVYAGDIAGAPIRPEHFSDAVLQHSLEHADRPRDVLIALRGALAPGGRIHIAVPNGDSAGLRRLRQQWGHLSVPGHLWFFDAASLDRLLEETGFRVVEHRSKVTWVFHRTLLVEAVRTRDWLLGARVVVALGAMVRARRRDVLRIVAAVA
jgi:SAM-dependent methyltransferase